MNLASIFSSIAYKRLVPVDLPHYGSNQHELNGVGSLRELFGTADRSTEDISWHYFSEEQPRRSEGSFTFYDARAKSGKRTGRSEWRFYYKGTCLEVAEPNDLLVLARTASGLLHGLIFEGGSAACRDAISLFELSTPELAFELVGRERLATQSLTFLRHQILAEMGFQSPSTESDEDLVTAEFGLEWPSTEEMSRFARDQVTDTNPDNIDETLVRWLEREYDLFKALEKVKAWPQIESGFQDVEEFLSLSLSIQNRRKARMGRSLENHLAAIFDLHKVRYSNQAKTEGKSTPDFIFPGESEYHQECFNSGLLVMLAAKSSCKERWRQILIEAERIPAKHLCTLQPSISTHQTDQMKDQNVTLVVPSPLHDTYGETQRAEMMSVAEFVEFVRHKQERSA